MVDIFDRTPERVATQSDLVKYDLAREQVTQLDTSGSFDGSDSNQRLFFVAFDGTGKIITKDRHSLD